VNSSSNIDPQSPVSSHREIELLFICARIGLEPDYAKRMKELLQEEMDWKYVIEAANRHGVMPLVYSNLKAVSSESAPSHVLNALSSQFVANAQHNLLFAGELSKILGLFEAHGIPAIPFKGPVLATEVYGSLALRQFCDLDILVHFADVLRVKELLITHGYKAEFSLTCAQEQAYLRSQCEYNFISADGRVPIEIHWAFVPRYFPYGIETDDLWKRARRTYSAGKQVWSFSAGDLLLILSLHGMKHAWDRLALICDVAELINNHEMDWQQIEKTADDCKLHRILLVGLGLASTHARGIIPDKLLERVQSDRASLALVNQVHKELFKERGPWFEKVRCYFFHMKAGANWKYRYQFAIRRALFPNYRDLFVMRLPKSLYFLYYVIRPLRVSGEFLRAVKNCFAKTTSLSKGWTE
jgi:hypothetical protein